MNIWASALAAALLLRFTASAVADLLNLKALRDRVPPELQEFCDEGTYRRSQDYTRARVKFGLLQESFDLMVLFLFWFAGGFPFLDGLLRAWDLGSVATGLLFMFSLALLARILSLPFSMYATFVIEEKFGFNRTDVSTYLKDVVKSGLLAALVGGTLAAGFMVLFEAVGPRAWLLCWLAATVYVLGIHFVAPAWILPLFNRFTPLPQGELRKSIEEISREARFAVKEIYVMDGSKRSSKSNAFFTGFGKNRRIVLFDTLVGGQTVPEVVAVLAHEIGHYRKRHLLQGMILSILHMGVALFLLSLVLENEALFAAFGMKHISVYAGMVFFGLLLSPLEVILSPFLNYLSRRNEYEADRFAVEATGKPQVLEDALKKLSVDNLANLTPHPFTVLLRYSHPPLLERIAALREAAAAVGRAAGVAEKRLLG